LRVPQPLPNGLEEISSFRQICLYLYFFIQLRVVLDADTET
jgi:hypothetical protein